MIGDFSRGFGYAFAGLKSLRRPGIGRYVALPLLVNLVMFAAGGWWLALSLGDLIAWVQGYLPQWLDWLAWLLWPLAVAGFLAVAWFGFTLLANLVGSPFNGLLAEKVARLEGKTPGPGRPLWQEVARAPVAEVRKLGYFAVLALPALVLFIVPVVNVAAPAVWLAVSAWMLAVEYADYPMGNEGMEATRQRDVLRRRRGLALGFGAGVLVMTLVPILNFLSMPAGVVGATLLWTREIADDSTAGASASGKMPAP
ncbi:MAG: sulfate transporter CysZ [Gammaproteobacteria bacterium]|jgi:CysZ protein